MTSAPSSPPAPDAPRPVMLLELGAILRRVLQPTDADPVLVPSEVRFEPPTDTWAAAVTAPTLSLFLFDVSENTDVRTTAVQTAPSAGAVLQGMPARYIDLRFMVSAFAPETTREPGLLWAALETLLRYEQYPNDLKALFVDEHSALAAQMVTHVGQAADSARLPAVWSALRSPARSAFAYVVTVPVVTRAAVPVPVVVASTTRLTAIPPTPPSPAASAPTPAVVQPPAASPAPAAPAAAQALPGVTGPGTSAITRLAGWVSGPGGNGLSGVVVEVEGSTQSVTTNAAGQFVVSGLRGQAVNLKVKLANGEVQPTTVDAAVADSHSIGVPQSS